MLLRSKSYLTFSLFTITYYLSQSCQPKADGFELMGCGMLILDIIVSGFAAWGLFCAAKFFADGFMTPKDARPRPVVRLTGSESPRDIAELCENARKAVIPNRGEIFFLVCEENDFSRAVREELEKLSLTDVKIIYERNGQK